MKSSSIALETLTPKKPTKVKIENGELHIPAEEAMTGKSRHHVIVPGKYTIPFRIDMTVKTKYLRINQLASQLTLYIGKGSVYFNGGHTSAVDIITADSILPNAVYHNDMQSGEFVDLSVTFGSEMMWASVNNKICFVAKNPRYVETQQDSATMNGLDIIICGGTSTKLAIKSLIIAEYQNDEPDMPKEIVNLPELSAFELFVSGLHPQLHDEVIKTDKYLMNDMKSSLKFRRSIDKHGHLTYQSPFGFSYSIREFGVGEYHGTSWVKSPNKPDYTNEVLNYLAKTSPKLADKVFNNFHGCEVHERKCARMTTIDFNGKSKIICAGRIYFKMLPSEFDDVRKVIEATSEVVRTAAKHL